MQTIEIVLPRHIEHLNSGNAKVIALKHSHIEGYFLKDDVLEVVRLVGSMLKVKTVQGYNSYLICNKAVLVNDFEVKVYCDSCGSLDKDKHTWKCETIKEAGKDD